MATIAESRPRTRDWELFAPLTGVLAVVCWVLGIILLDVTSKDEGAKLLAAYKGHDGRIWAGGMLWLLGIAFFAWFLGSLRTRLLAAEGPTSRLTSLAFAGGIATAICGALVPAGDLGGAGARKHIDESAALALHNMTLGPFVAAEYFCVVLVAATGLLSLRTGVLPRWFAWISLAAAVGLIIAPIGWAILIFGFPIWVLITTYLIWQPPATTAV
jgi:hypothetical protein